MLQEHMGGCHCGRVRFKVEMKLEKAINCNCSICIRRGSLLDFVPEAKFKLLQGENELQEYQFNKHLISHLFCKTCGILSFAKAKGPDGSPMAAINVRCIDGVDLKKIAIREYDGASR